MARRFAGCRQMRHTVFVVELSAGSELCCFIPTSKLWNQPGGGDGLSLDPDDFLHLGN